MLEDHSYLPAPDLPELLGRHLRNVVFVQVDLALGRLDKAVDHPQERRLATPREPDDHEDLTRLNLEVRVVDADGRPSFSTSALLFPERRISRACRARRPKTTEQFSTRMIGSWPSIS